MVQTTSAIFFATAALIAATPALGAAIPQGAQQAGLKHASTTTLARPTSSAHSVHGAVEHAAQFGTGSKGNILKDNNNIQKDKNRLSTLEHELHHTEHDLHHNEFDLHRTESHGAQHDLGKTHLAENTRGSKNLGTQRGRLSPEHDLHNSDHHSTGTARPSGVRGANAHPSGTSRINPVHGQDRLTHGAKGQGPHDSLHPGSGSRSSGASRPTGSGKARLTHGQVDLAHNAKPSGTHATHSGGLAKPTGTSRSNLVHQKDNNLLHKANDKLHDVHAVSHTGTHTSAARPTGTQVKTQGILDHNRLAHAPAASSARPSSHTLAAAAAKPTATHKTKSKIQQEIDDLYALEGRAFEGGERPHHRVHQSFRGHEHQHEPQQVEGRAFEGGERPHHRVHQSFRGHEHAHHTEDAADAEPRSEGVYEFDARSLKEELSDLMARSYFDFYDELD